MTVTITKKAALANVVVSGKIDSSSSPELLEKFLPVFATATEVILDLKKVDGVTSAGLRVLIKGQKTASDKHSNLAIINVSKDIMKLIDAAGYTRILHIKK